MSTLRLGRQVLVSNAQLIFSGIFSFSSVLICIRDAALGKRIVKLFGEMFFSNTFCCFSATAFAFVILAGIYGCWVSCCFCSIVSSNPECFDLIWIFGLLLTFVEIRRRPMKIIIGRLQLEYLRIVFPNCCLTLH